MTIALSRPIHPGEILREEFMLPLQIKPYSLAKAVYIPRTRIERLVREETSVTADTALRLGRYFSTSAEFWMNLQRSFDLKIEMGLKKTDIDLIEPHVRAAA